LLGVDRATRMMGSCSRGTPPVSGQLSPGGVQGWCWHPVRMVWRCWLSVDEYVLAGRDVEVPRPWCPDCERPMRFRFGYERDARSGGGLGRRVWVRRAQCGGCGRSHALLPSFLFERRLDVVDDIGAVVEAVCDGRGVVEKVAKAGDVPYTTARDWLRRFWERAAMLASGFAALAVSVGGEVGIDGLVTEPGRRALGALRLVVECLGWSSGWLWAWASLVTGGKLLGCAMDPPWTVLGGRRLMPPVP